MAFNKFCASVIKGCTTLRVKDNTGAYDATSNPNGWDAPTTITTADVTAATITYYIGDSTSGTEVDVLSQLPAGTVVGSFTLAEIDVEDTYADGFITIVYTLTTATDTYTTRNKILFTCSSRCCIDKMWAEIAEKCNCNCDLKQMIDDALMAEGMLKAVKSAASCNSTTSIDTMLAKIKKLCEFNNCNCN
jgi:hypothetical protein